MIKLYCTHENEKLQIEYEVFNFPAGEVHFKIKPPTFPFTARNLSTIIFIVDIESCQDLILLKLLSDYFISYGREIIIDLIYTPYSRQDRKTSYYEPFSFKTFTEILNSCHFSKVTIHDPHSDVIPALIKNCEVMTRLNIIMKYCNDILTEDSIIVSPDSGAMKINNEIAHNFNFNHISATKVRDVQTGEISHTELHTSLDLKDKRLIILDDICDGGRTFIELAKVLKKREPKEIHLFTTVGLYTQGLEVLDKHFDSINCFYRRIRNEQL